MNWNLYIHIFISSSHLKHHHEEDPQTTAVQRQSNQALCGTERITITSAHHHNFYFYTCLFGQLNF